MNSVAAAAPPPRPVRIGYGVAELGIAGVEVLIRVGLLIFYTDVVGLDPRLAGLAVALGVLWDAVTDPLMGHLSDRTRSRFGRRRPWIVVGAVALAVAVVLLFSPPSLESQTAKFLVLLGSYVLVNTAMTVIAVPHSAMAGDLCDAGPERMELFGWRLLFANLGLVLGTAIPGLLVAGAGDAGTTNGEADRATALMLAAVTIVSAAVTVYATRGRDAACAPSTTLTGWRDSLRAVLRNRYLWPLLGGFVVANIGLNVNTTMALYYYRYRLELEETATRGIIAVFMLVFCLSIPLWLRAAERYGKLRSVIAGALTLGVMSCIAYPLFPSGNAYWPLLTAFIGGAAVGCVVLLDALLADVVDVDRLRSRESRFGLYFGVWKMGAKASRALAIALSGQLLALVGFTANAPQSAETSLGIALIFGPLVGVLFMLAALVLCSHRLDERRHARVLRLLARREAR